MKNLRYATALALLAATSSVAQSTSTSTGSPNSRPSQASTSSTTAEPSPPDAVEPGRSATPPTPPDAPSTSKQEEEKQVEKQEQSYRVMGVVPRFGVTHLHAPPLTAGGKFHLFAKTAFDPVTFVLIGAQAGISQAQNSFPAYGQGAEGYGKRYGAAFTDSVTSGFFANFFYPVIFKQDPRYFRQAEGSFGSRFGHSLVEQVVAHQDGGGRMVHVSNILGALTSGGIANAYYPRADRGFGLTMSRAGISLLYGELGGLFNEFWPDLQNRMSKKKKSRSQPPESPASSLSPLPGDPLKHPNR